MMPEGGGVPAARSLKREFTFRSAFALAFAFVSPIIGLYTIFGLGLATSGPSFWWAIPIALAGQVLVALTLGELASIWPFAGGTYQWARWLAGRTYGWFAGWAYVATLVVATAAAPYVAATFFAALLGIDAPSNTTKIVLALVLLAVATVCNLLSRRVLKIFVALSVSAELIGSLGLAILLLLWYRENGFSVLFAGPGTSGAFDLSALVVVVGIAGFALIGFESAGAVAEETQEPRLAAPKAMLAALVLVGGILAFSCLAMILALPASVAAGGGTGDPIVGTLSATFGAVITRPFLVIVLIGFTAGTTAGQAAVSRAVYALARDRALPFSGTLASLSSQQRLPVNAILAVTVVSAILFLLTYLQSAFATLVTLTVAGFYISWAFPVMAALYLRLTGRFPRRGPFSLGRAGLIVNALAALWLVLEAVNISWPRLPELPWYQNWGVPVVVAIVGVLGVAVYLTVRTRIAPVVEGQSGEDSGPSYRTADPTVTERVDAGKAGGAR